MRNDKGPLLGGSPLGLVVYTQPTKDGMSQFNGGSSRNINIIDYNIGKGKTSMFTGGTRLNPWPNIKTLGFKDDKTNNPQSDKYSGVNEVGESIPTNYARNTLHNNDVYDTSILNIIEKLSASKSAALRPSDFAYLKYLGVYPNNRLMIARKFLTPIHDDLNKIGISPKSVLISWKPEGTDFLDITVGEVWTEADANFEGVLNKMGEDFMGKNLGGKLGAALNLVPLPGFTETIQRVVLEKLGVLQPGQKQAGSPAGNPNVIKKAKRRGTPGTGEAWSGLKYTLSIQFDTEYEQKFISGIDPTVAFLDIIGNILSFGTQDSSTYGMTGAFAKKISVWSTHPSILVKDMIAALKDAFTVIKSEIAAKVKELTTAIQEKIKAATAEKAEETEPANDEAADLAKESDAISSAEKQLNNFIDLITKSLENTVRKYKEELKGIANALSGQPSTPWHVTIGNPLRPIFCSGDMYTDDVKLTLGPVLAFNDLPASIKVSFQMKPARECGLQEIMAKFNTGNLRVVNVRRDGSQTENQLFKSHYMYKDAGPNDVPGNPNAANSQNVNSGSSGSSGDRTRENAQNPVTNRDANSTPATLGGGSSGVSGTSGVSSTSVTAPPTTSGTSGISSSGSSGT